LRPLSVRAKRLRCAVAGSLLIAMTVVALAPAASTADTQGAPVAFSIADRHVRYGQPLVATGRLAVTDAGRTVVLVGRNGAGVERALATARVAPNGAFRLATKALHSSTVLVRLQGDGGIAAAAAGTARPAAEQLVYVAARISAATRRLDVLAGHRAVVRGALRPGGAGRRVVLQARLRGHYRTIARDRTDARGRYLLRVWRHRTGSMRVRVRFLGDADNLSVTRRVGRLEVYRVAVASWYGPGLYGGHLGCGGRLGAGQLGVANKTLPCGTLVTVRYGGRSVRVPVIDRGPYVGGREFDLTAATAHRLGFGGHGPVWVTR
jgi:rare lipoprotein A